jgi:predicted DNA-binding antitoxin AbrB/MazE fold protein
MPINYNSVSNLQSIARQEAHQNELDAEAIGTGSDDKGYAVEVSKKLLCPVAMADGEQLAINIQGLLKEKAEKAKHINKKRTGIDKNDKTNKRQGTQKGGANEHVGSKDQIEQGSKTGSSF